MNQPKPIGKHNSTIRAFVLGCDPTAFTKTEKEKPSGERKHLEFKVVFDIGGDDRYFAGILANLKEVGLGLDNIYVQNLVTDYQKEESSKNKNWLRIALDYIAPRMEEFDGIDPSRNIPAKEFYNLKAEIPIPEGANQLHRPLIPFYRHRYYSLNRHNAYAIKICQIFLD